MGKCVVKSCDSSSAKDHKSNGISFHLIPKDPVRKEKWIHIIRILRRETDWWPSDRSAICSKHFKEEYKIKPKHAKGNVMLSRKAIPIVDDESNSTHCDPGSSVEKQVDLDIDTDEEMLEILETPREHKLRKTIDRLKIVSKRRLQTLMNVRKKNRRLMRKNKILRNILNELKKKR